MKNETTFLTYSNSNCSDLWNPYFERLKKHSSEINRGVFISDVDPQSTHLWSSYSNEEPYWQVFSRSIDLVDTETLIYMQEDFILYEDVNFDLIDRAIDILKKDDRLSFVRLIRCGLVTEFPYEDNFYLHSPFMNNPHESINSYSMQPTIWKKDILKKLVEDVKCENWLENIRYTYSMNKLKIFGLYVYQNESRRGGHFDSKVFPYVATALVKGKWNTSEYPKEMNEIFKEFSIDKNKRGEI